jgi:anti-anti-sigma factor
VGRSIETTSTDRTLFSFERVECNGQAVFRLRGEIDLSTRDRMDDLLAEALSGTEGRVVLDIGQLRFVDAHTLRRWERAAVELHDRGAELVLRNASTLIRRLIDVTGLDEVTCIE